MLRIKIQTSQTYNLSVKLNGKIHFFLTNSTFKVNVAEAFYIKFIRVLISNTLVAHSPSKNHRLFSLSHSS